MIYIKKTSSIFLIKLLFLLSASVADSLSADTLIDQRINIYKEFIKPSFKSNRPEQNPSHSNASIMPFSLLIGTPGTQPVASNTGEASQERKKENPAEDQVVRSKPEKKQEPDSFLSIHCGSSDNPSRIHPPRSRYRSARPRLDKNGFLRLPHSVSGNQLII